MASKFVLHVPSFRKKEELLAAGLGEKRIKVSIDATAAQLHDTLLVAFENLKEGGGFEIMRCLPNSRTLVSLPIPDHGHTPASLKKEVGQARIYLRPLQSDLNLDTEDGFSSGEAVYQVNN